MENSELDNETLVDMQKSPQAWQRHLLEKVGVIEHALTIIAMTSAPVPKAIVDYMNKGISFAVTLSAMKAGVDAFERLGVERVMEVARGSHGAYWAAQGIIKNAAENNGIVVSDGDPDRACIYNFR